MTENVNEAGTNGQDNTTVIDNVEVLPPDNNTSLQPASRSALAARGIDLEAMTEEAIHFLTKDGWRVNETSCLFPEDREPSIEEILTKAGTVGRWGRAARVWLGDIIRQTNHKFGEMYDAFAEATGYTVDTLKQSVYAMAHVPPDHRLPGLTFYHMRLAADVKEEEQKETLQLAFEASDKPGQPIESTAFETIVKQVKKEGVQAVKARLSGSQAQAGDGQPATDAKQAARQQLQPFRMVERPIEPKESKEDYEAYLRAQFEEKLKRHLDPKYRKQAEARDAQAKESKRLEDKKTDIQTLIDKLPEGKDRTAFQKRLDAKKLTIEDANTLKADVQKAVKAQEGRATARTELEGLVKNFPEAVSARLLAKFDKGAELKEVKTAVKGVQKVVDEINSIEKEADREGFIEMLSDGKKDNDAILQAVKDYKKEIKESADNARKQKLEQATSKERAAAELRKGGDTEGADKLEAEAKQLRWEAEGGEGAVPANWNPKTTGKTSTRSKKGAGAAKKAGAKKRTAKK